MVAAALTLVTLYDRMVHVTCLAHGLHRVCEKIRLEYEEIDSLIASANQIFVKSLDRVSGFHFFAPDVPLPPEPVLTRWGTWLLEALYYSQNFESVYHFLNALDPEDAVCIRRAQELICGPQVRNQLAFISANSSQLIRAIASLEAQNLSLVESTGIISGVCDSINALTGIISLQVQEKLQNILTKIVGLLFSKTSPLFSETNALQIA